MKKNLIVTLCLSLILLIFGLFVFLPKSEAQNNILQQLLDLPAPPPPNPLVRNYTGKERPLEFYSQKNPPADNAPIEDLLEYWGSQNGLDKFNNYTIEPSDVVLNRILEAIEKNPIILGNYLNVLEDKSETGEIVKRLYDRALSDKDPNNYQAVQLKEWLTENTDYFSDDLLTAANQVRETRDYVTNQTQLLALAKVNWEKARPVLERLINDSNQPISQTLARWAFYQHALKENDSLEADTYRDALKKTVEDRSAKPGNRDLAMDALVDGGDFAGRDEWYFSLLEDETLSDIRVGGQSYTGLATLLIRSPPDKYVDKMLELVKGSNQNVRNVAARNLSTVLSENDPEVIKALLPWLENPNWAKDISGARALLVIALSRVEIPESVPGLIAILNEKAIVKAYEDDLKMTSNTMSMNSNMSDAARGLGTGYGVGSGIGARNREIYPFRENAINALMKQKNLQAAAALQQILPEVQAWKRPDVIKAILLSGGFTMPEQIDALESRARETQAETEKNQKAAALRGGEDLEISKATNSLNQAAAKTRAAIMSNSNMMMSDSEVEPFNPSDVKHLLGDQLVKIEEPSGELVAAAVYRIKSLESSEPQVAETLRGIVQQWSGEAVNAVLLDDLAKGKSDVNAVVKLLSLRKTLREKQINAIYDARRDGNPFALGVAACLLEDENDYAGILASANEDAKIAMLGCARLIRARLSLQNVAQNLKSSNKVLAKAAELYIESEDSPAARQIIYALYPNQATILGAKFFFGEIESSAAFSDAMTELFNSVNNSAVVSPYYLYAGIARRDNLTEERLKKEITTDDKLLGIYAYDSNFVRIYRDGAIFSWEEDEARYRERRLSDAEFNSLKNFLASNDVNNLPPFVSYCEGCAAKELLMLGKSGGRRIFIYTDSKINFIEGLEKIFENLRKPPATLHYWLEKNIAGLNILFADENLKALAVWKNGDDLRVLINDENRRKQIDEELEKMIEPDYSDPNFDFQKTYELYQKRRSEKTFESYSWRKFAGDKLGDLVGQPADIDFIKSGGEEILPEYGGMRWSAKAGDVEVRAVGGDLYKIVGGQETKIKNGYYLNPVITGDKRWVSLVKFDDKTENSTLVRINLQNNEEFVVRSDKYKSAMPLAYIASAGKILLAAGNSIDYETGEIKKGDYFTLDADTGAMQTANGEFRPLLQQTFRELQKTENVDQVWAAIPDESKKETQIGTYNAKTFAFKSLLSVPQLSFNSMNMWVDEAANKVYIVYNGQLLSIPLKREESKPEKIG